MTSCPSTVGTVLLAMLLSAACGVDGSTSETLDDYLDSIAREGAAGVVLIQQGATVRQRRGFGWADCAGREPMTADHVVLIGSITKEFTQLLSYVLVDEGKLEFDEPIGKYIKDFPAELSAITVRQLVFHTSGLPDLVDAEGRPERYSVEYDYQPVTREQMIRRAARAKLRFEPGEREEYSNLGYGLLAAVLEIASGESYESLLASRIFQPAGMQSTGYLLPNADPAAFAEGCRNGERWGSPLLDGMWGDEGPSWNLKAAGGLLSTVDDLARWFGALGAGKFLSPETQRLYLDERLTESQRFGQRVMGPAGSNGIFNAVGYWAETSDLRVVVVTSRSDFQAEREGVARQVILAAADELAESAATN